MRPDPFAFALPAAYGTVRRVQPSAPSRNNRGVVVHIQDVHFNHEAQTNIGLAIQALIDQGEISLIALEGAFAPLDLTPFRKFPHPAIVRRVADVLLKENKMSGPVHAAMTSGRAVPLAGVDDQAHYQANVEAYREAAAEQLPARASLQKSIDQCERRKRDRMNPALAAFDARVSAYRQGAVPMGRYLHDLRAIHRQIPPEVRNFLDALAMEENLDFTRVEAERALVLSRLVERLDLSQRTALLNAGAAYRLGQIRQAEFYDYLAALSSKNGVDLDHYPALAAYLRYLLLSDRIDPAKLFPEIRQLEEAAYAALTRTPEERQLIQQSRHLYLLGKLIEFALTREEWEEYSSFRRKPESRPLPSRKSLDPGLRRDDDLSSFEAFYTEAERRDELMVENLLRDTKYEVRGTPLVVLVTGGFHAEGIDRRLVDAGCTVIEFVPKISKVDVKGRPAGAGASAYLSVFTQEKTPLEKLFEGNKLFLADNPLGPAARYKAGTLMNAVREHLTPGDVPASLETKDQRSLTGLGSVTQCEAVDRGKKVRVQTRFEDPAVLAVLDLRFDEDGRILSYSERVTPPPKQPNAAGYYLAKLFGAREETAVRIGWVTMVVEAEVLLGVPVAMWGNGASGLSILLTLALVILALAFFLHALPRLLLREPGTRGRPKAFLLKAIVFHSRVFLPYLLFAAYLVFANAVPFLARTGLTYTIGLLLFGSAAVIGHFLWDLWQMQRLPRPAPAEEEAPVPPVPPPLPVEEEIDRVPPTIDFLLSTDYDKGSTGGSAFAQTDLSGRTPKEKAKTLMKIHELDPDFAAILAVSFGRETLGVWKGILEHVGADLLAALVNRGMYFYKGSMYHRHNGRQFDVYYDLEGLMYLFARLPVETSLSLLARLDDDSLSAVVRELAERVFNSVNPVPDYLRRPWWEVLAQVPKDSLARSPGEFEENIRDLLHIPRLEIPLAPYVGEASVGNPGRAMGPFFLIEDRYPDEEKLLEMNLKAKNNGVVAMSILPEAYLPIGPFRGLLTFQRDSELTHAATRARAWKAPHAFWPGPESLRHLVGKIVVFEAGKDGKVSIREATPEEIASAENGQGLEPVKLTPVNLDEGKYYFPFRDPLMKEPKEMGYKAAQLNQLAEKRPVLTDPKIKLSLATGAGIPYRTFTHLLKKNKKLEEFQKLIRELRSADEAHAQRNLDHIADIIRDLDMSEIWEEIWNPMTKADRRAVTADGVFVRLTTPDQDLPYWPGLMAGIYLTIPNVRGYKALWEGMREAYEAAWSRAAYFERRKFGINEEEFHPAIWLVANQPPDYAFAIHTMDVRTGNPDHLVINVVQGYGESLFSDDPKFAGFSPTRIVVDKKTGAIIEKTPGNKPFVVRSRERGGTRVEKADPAKEFLDLPDADRIIRALAETGIQSEAVFKQSQDMEGVIRREPPGKKYDWRITLVQTRAVALGKANGNGPPAPDSGLVALSTRQAAKAAGHDPYGLYTDVIFAPNYEFLKILYWAVHWKEFKKEHPGGFWRTAIRAGGLFFICLAMLAPPGLIFAIPAEAIASGDQAWIAAFAGITYWYFSLAAAFFIANFRPSRQISLFEKFLLFPVCFAAILHGAFNFVFRWFGVALAADDEPTQSIDEILERWVPAGDDLRYLRTDWDKLPRKDGPGVRYTQKDHLQFVLDALNEAPKKSWFHKMPSFYRNILIDPHHRPLLEAFIALHDIGKFKVEPRRQRKGDVTITVFPGHEEASAKMILADARLAAGEPWRDILIDLARLHGMFGPLMRTLTSAAAIDEFAKNLSPHLDPVEVIPLLAVASHLDYRGTLDRTIEPPFERLEAFAAAFEEFRKVHSARSVIAVEAVKTLLKKKKKPFTSLLPDQWIKGKDHVRHSEFGEGIFMGNIQDENDEPAVSVVFDRGGPQTFSPMEAARELVHIGREGEKETAAKKKPPVPRKAARKKSSRKAPPKPAPAAAPVVLTHESINAATRSQIVDWLTYVFPDSPSSDIDAMAAAILEQKRGIGAFKSHFEFYSISDLTEGGVSDLVWFDLATILGFPEEDLDDPVPPGEGRLHSPSGAPKHLAEIEERLHEAEAKRRNKTVTEVGESYVRVPFVATEEGVVHWDTFRIAMAAFWFWLGRSVLWGFPARLMLWLHIRGARSPDSDLNRAGYVLQEKLKSRFSVGFPFLKNLNLFAKPTHDEVRSPGSAKLTERIAGVVKRGTPEWGLLAYRLTLRLLIDIGALPAPGSGAAAVSLLNGGDMFVAEQVPVVNVDKGEDPFDYLVETVGEELAKMGLALDTEAVKRNTLPADPLHFEDTPAIARLLARLQEGGVSPSFFFLKNTEGFFLRYGVARGLDAGQARNLYEKVLARLLDVVPLGSTFVLYDDLLAPHGAHSTARLLNAAGYRDVLPELLPPAALAHLQEAAIRSPFIKIPYGPLIPLSGRLRVFRKENPVVVEIGFGDGQVLAEAARKNPRVDHVGLEMPPQKQFKGWPVKVEGLARLPNVRVVLEDAREAVARLFGPSSVIEFWVLFPFTVLGPGTFFNEDLIFLNKIYEKLKPGGRLLVVTEEPDYAFAGVVAGLTEKVFGTGSTRIIPINKRTVSLKKRRIDLEKSRAFQAYAGFYGDSQPHLIEAVKSNGAVRDPVETSKTLARRYIEAVRAFRAAGLPTAAAAIEELIGNDFSRDLAELNVSWIQAADLPPVEMDAFAAAVEKELTEDEKRSLRWSETQKFTMEWATKEIEPRELKDLVVDKNVLLPVGSATDEQFERIDLLLSLLSPGRTLILAGSTEDLKKFEEEYKKDDQAWQKIRLAPAKDGGVPVLSAAHEINVDAFSSAAEPWTREEAERQNLIAVWPPETTFAPTKDLDKKLRFLGIPWARMLDELLGVPLTLDQIVNSIRAFLASQLSA